MRFLNSAVIFSSLLIPSTFATCYWDTCCYTNHNGPSTCPPALWHVSLSGSYCEVSICPAGCTNPTDGSCDCCDIVTGECRGC